MNATPLQRYALRLLFATNRCVMINFSEWRNLQQNEAEIMMKPFGGQESIIRETVLPAKEKTQQKSIETDESTAPAIAERSKDTGREL